MDNVIFLIFATSPMWGAVLWELWFGIMLPLFVPAREIHALAEVLMCRHGGRAEEVAFLNESKAWFECDSFEQGKWRRVRRYIKRVNRGLALLSLSKGRRRRWQLLRVRRWLGVRRFSPPSC